MRRCLLAVAALAVMSAFPAAAQTIRAMLDQACSADDAEACFKLGALHAGGGIVEQNMVIAEKLYAKACHGGVLKGCYNLGVIYAGASDIEHNELIASRFYEMACAGDLVAACYNLGLLYVSEGELYDDDRADLVWRKACAAKDVMSCYNLGVLHDKTGRSDALEHYGKACALGHEHSCLRLGREAQ